MADTFPSLKGLLHRVKSTVSRQRSNAINGLRIVRDPENAEIDIVAVHGLGDQGFRSWITLDPKGGRSKSWLEELLGQDIPNARIMTFAYLSDDANYRHLVRNVLYGRGLELVSAVAYQRHGDGSGRRPLFFIAHSLGGWIVKRALIISSEAMRSELRDVELSTCGVAFFGTLSPGRPSSPTPLARVIRRTTSGLGGEGPGSLQRSSSSMQPSHSDLEWLEKQMEAFKALAANLPRVSFYETKKSVDGFIVEQRHSMAGSDGSQIGLKATHSDLVKFSGRDANYNVFIGKFREMVDNAQSSTLMEDKRKSFDFAPILHLEYLSQGFSIPYKLPSDPDVIINRQDLLDKLTAIFQPPAAAQTLHLSIASLCGDPGTGKSTLAKQYAEVNKHNISFVFWIWAGSWETVVTSYLEFANALVAHYSDYTPRSQVENDLGLTGVADMLKVKNIQQLDTFRIKSVVRAVQDWLYRPQNDRWLLIFDKVEPTFDIFDFIPLTLRGRIILTSRDSSSCAWGTPLQVGAMKEEQAVQLLGAIVGEDALHDIAQVEAASRVVRQLKCHPQSISLAGSTIRKKGHTIFNYQRQLEVKMPLGILGSTLDQSPVTRTVLRVSAMLSSSMIPVTLFNPAMELKDAPSRFLNVFQELKAFREAGPLDDILQYLLDQNFIQTPSPSETSTRSRSSSSSPPSSQDSTSSSSLFDYFILDPAARDHVRGTLSMAEKAENAWLACNVCVDGIRKKELDSVTLPEIHDFGRIMAPHAKTCYDDWSSVLARWTDNDDDKDIDWHVLGNVCMTQGALEQAIGCFELSLQQKPNNDTIERIQTSLSLASLLQQTGQHQRSREILAKIDMESIDKALGFRVAFAKASAAAARGELDGAEDQYEMLEHKQEEELGLMDTGTIGTVQKLASTMAQLGRMEEAQVLARRVYISYQRMFGPTHPMTVEALDELADISRASYAIDQAEFLYTRAVEIKTRTLGAEHPSTAHAIERLAFIDDLRGRYAEARAKYQTALDIIAPSLGKAHPQYTKTMEKFAFSCRQQGHSLDDDSNCSRSDGNSQNATAAAVGSKAEKALLREASCRRAFEDAERLYLDVLATKKSARGLYSEAQLAATGSELCEMYENEAFFKPCRAEKVSNLMAFLREVPRRGTM